MTDRLVEIDRIDLSNLKNLYTPDGAKSYVAYTTIDNYIRWFEQDPNVKHIKFYCLNGDITDGTFVVTDRCSAYADTFNQSHENLSRLLQLIDYSKGYVFLSIRSELRSIVKEALQKLNVELLPEGITLLYRLSKEDALKFDVQSPEGVELRPVTEQKDIEKANSLWRYRDTNSLHYLQRMAKYNASVGAFNVDETLMAWIFRIPNGLLGLLQTDETYRRQGYGGLVLRSISKQIAEIGHDIYAGVAEENLPSRSLFEKHGFKSVGKVYWIPTKMT